MNFLSIFIAKRSFVAYLIIDYINLFILLLFTKFSSNLNNIFNLSALLFIFITWFILSYFSDKYKEVKSGLNKNLKGIVVKTFIVTSIFEIDASLR